MESLEAVGLAANILQLVEYDSKVLKQARVRGKRGFVATDLERDTSHLKRQATKLAVDGSYTPSLRSISALAKDCLKLSENLIAKVDAIKVQSSQSTWKAIKNRVKRDGEKNDLDELGQKIDNYRTQLEVQVIDAIR